MLTYLKTFALATLLCVSVACDSSAASSQPSDRFHFSDDEARVVLQYEGTNQHIRAEQPVAQLTVYGSGRAVGRMPTRSETEWLFSREEILALLGKLEQTGILSLTTDQMVTAHKAFVAEHHSGGGPWVQDAEQSRLMISVEGYRLPGRAEPSAPLDLDISYEGVRFYARALPEVEELESFAKAVKILDRMLFDRARSRDQRRRLPSRARAPRGPGLRLHDRVRARSGPRHFGEN